MLALSMSVLGSKAENCALMSASDPKRTSPILTVKMI